MPVRLGHDRERCLQRPEHRRGGHSRHPDPTVGMDPQPIHVICSGPERPVRESDVKPVLRCAERPPVLTDGGVGRRGEVKHLIRADAGHHEATAEIVAFQRPRRIRRGDGREVLPVARDGRDAAVAARRRLAAGDDPEDKSEHGKEYASRHGLVPEHRPHSPRRTQALLAHERDKPRGCRRAREEGESRRYGAWKHALT